jgi:hypothetical protein
MFIKWKKKSDRFANPVLSDMSGMQEIPRKPVKPVKAKMEKPAKAERPKKPAKVAKSNRKYQVVANANDLAHISNRKLLVGGELVVSAMHANQVQAKGFIAQKPRDAVGGVLSSLSKDATKVHVSVHPNLLDIGNCRVAFTIDGYMSYGLSQRKGTVAVLGGIERDDGAFHVDILVFESGRLADLYDRELPEKTSITFEAAAESVIDEIRSKYPRAKVVQAAPLSDWEIEGVEYVGEKALKRLSFYPISKTGSSRGGLLLPSAVGVMGCLIFCGAIGSGWNKYSEAQARYEAAATHPAIKEQGGVDNDYINVMSQRRFFMEGPRKQDLMPDLALNIVRGVASVQAVQIVELKLPAPAVNPQGPQVGIPIVNPDGNPNLITAARVPDCWIRISVPRANSSAMDQAKDVIKMIANSTGMSLRLVHQGVQDDRTRRIYTIEGFIHG